MFGVFEVSGPVDFLSILVQHRLSCIFKDDVCERVAFDGLFANLAIEIVSGVFGFVVATRHSRFVKRGIRANGAAFDLLPHFRYQRPRLQSGGIFQQPDKRGAHARFVGLVQVRVGLQRLVIMLNRLVVRLDRDRVG